MENPGILKWRTWTHAQKGFIAGALFGFLGTLAINGFAFALGDVGETGLNLFTYALGWIGVLASIPGYLVLKTFGWQKGFLEDLTLMVVAVSALTNAFLLGLALASADQVLRLTKTYIQAKRKKDL